MYPVVLNTTFPSQIEMGILVFGEQEKLSEKGQEPTELQPHLTPGPEIKSELP